MKWPTGAPVICGGPPVREHVVELAGLAADRAVRVDHALRVLGGARGEADERRRVGVDGGGPGDRVGVEQRRRTAWPRPGSVAGGRVADDEPARDRVGAASSVVPHRQVVGVAEAVGGDDDGGLGGAEDVVDLLGAVEVHDRHDDGAEVGGGPERDAGLDPVRAAGGRRRRPARRPGRRSVAGERPGGPVDVGEGAGPRAAPSSARGTRRRPSLAEAVGDHRAEGAVVPPALGPVALRQVVRAPSAGVHSAIGVARFRGGSPSVRSPCSAGRATGVVGFGERRLSSGAMATPAPTAHRRGRTGTTGSTRCASRGWSRRPPTPARSCSTCPPSCADDFAYEAGQFCTFRVLDRRRSRTCAATRCRRRPASTTSCRSPSSACPAGSCRTGCSTRSHAGDDVDVTLPAGRVPARPTATATSSPSPAGSGITPVFSHRQDRRWPRPIGRVRLLYANRDRDVDRSSRAELDAPGRPRTPTASTVDAPPRRRRAASSTPTPCAAFVGRRRRTPTCYVCGPGPVHGHRRGDAARRRASTPTASTSSGSRRPSRLVAEPGGRAPTTATPPTQVTIELDGRTDTVEHRPGTTILQTARQMGMSPPFSCESGSCATCMARLVEGTVEMHVQQRARPTTRSTRAGCSPASPCPPRRRSTSSTDTRS